MLLETAFLNAKTKDINYINILYVVKLWVFSVIAEIRKNTQVAKRRLHKERNSIATLHRM